MAEPYRRARTEADIDMPRHQPPAKGVLQQERTQPPLARDTAAWDPRPPHLRILNPDDGAWDVVLEGTSAIIGRASGCEIELPYGAVSRRHCQLDRREGSWLVTDLGSRGGSGLNGRALRAHAPFQLSHGDTLQISRTVLQFRRDQRLVRSDGLGMQFSALPSSVSVRVRVVRLPPNEVFDPGDTILVGRHGGLQIGVPASMAMSTEVVLELELTYPDGRFATSLAECLCVVPGRGQTVVQLKLHKLTPDQYDATVAKALRDPWVSLLPQG